MEFKVGDRVCFEYYGDIKFGIIRDIYEEDVYPIIVSVNGEDLEFCFLEDGRLDFGGSIILKHVISNIETLDQYQAEALKTAIFPEEVKLIYPVLGLTGEAGEVAEKLKKIIRDKGGVMTDEDRQALKKELVDVLRYVSVLANSLGFEFCPMWRRRISRN